MSWMGWVAISVFAFALAFLLVVVVVSYLEGWKWRRPK